MGDDMIKRLGLLDGGSISEGAFSPGPALWVGKREVAHFDDDQTLDVRLTKEVIRNRRAALRVDGRITFRRGSSDWLEVRIESEADMEFALSLVADAIAANLGSAAPGPPTTGAELQRRRRFH
jgi:hypothetical protein